MSAGVSWTGGGLPCAQSAAKAALLARACPWSLLFPEFPASLCFRPIPPAWVGVLGLTAVVREAGHARETGGRNRPWDESGNCCGGDRERCACFPRGSNGVPRQHGAPSTGSPCNHRRYREPCLATVLPFCCCCWPRLKSPVLQREPNGEFLLREPNRRV